MNKSTKIAKNLAFSFTSWFCVAEQGMKDLEPLCRSTAFILPTVNKSFDSKYHVLTVGHSVSPWRFPRLYKQDWLQHVNEKHTYYTTELRHEDGELMTQMVMRPRVYHHPVRDLSIIHFDKDDEEKIHTHLVNCQVKLDFQLSSDDFIDKKQYEEEQKNMKDNEGLKFVGYNLVEKSVPNFDNFSSPSTISSDSNTLMVPNTVFGRYLGRTKAQTFAKTASVLQQGMCGGPVLLKKREDGILKERLVGMLEGIVPSDHPIQEIRDAAVFIEAGEIKQ